MILKTVVLTAVLGLLATAAFAEAGGNSGGGGGFVLRCSNQQGDSHTELADLWLAASGRGPFRKIGKQDLVKAQSGDTVEKFIAYAIKRAKNANLVYGELLEKTVIHINSRIEYTDPREKIIANNDTDIVAISDMCQLYAVARYSDFEDFLTIQPELEGSLSVVDIAALRIHEAIYKIKRDLVGETTSYQTQLEVGLLFSTAKLPKLDVSQIELPMLCTETSSSSEAKRSFAIGIQNNLAKRWNFVSTAGQKAFTLAPIAKEIPFRTAAAPGGSESALVYRHHVKNNTVNALVSGNVERGTFNCVKLK